MLTNEELKKFIKQVTDYMKNSDAKNYLDNPRGIISTSSILKISFLPQLGHWPPLR